MVCYYEKAFPEQVIVVYINPPLFICFRRILKRNKGDYREALKRYISDAKEFMGLDDLMEISKVLVLNSIN